MIQIKNLNVKSDRGFLALDDFSLYVCKGEIVGLAGVSGNGQKRTRRSYKWTKESRKWSNYI